MGDCIVFVDRRRNVIICIGKNGGREQFASALQDAKRLGKTSLHLILRELIQCEIDNDYVES
ncbi:hypothetical protein WI23_15970 [Burkholderia oklahomensis C6786]|nr:hypothetical protein WI23_15970 [Burkholderia oklahomensis C6786]